MMGPDWSPADCAGPCYSAATHVLDCGAEEERAMVEDKSLPVWELPAVPGPSVLVQFGEYKGAAVPVVRVFCSTTEHADRPAVVSGRFRVPWWPEDREEHAAYCQTCSRLAVFLGYFKPDHDGWKP